MSSHKLFALCALLMMAASAFAAPGDNNHTIEFKVQPSSAKGVTLETAVSPNGAEKTIQSTLTKGTLPPCAVRVMHLHNNVDETYLLLSGRSGVAIADPAGVITHDELKPMQAFVIPRNWVHTTYNPDCKEEAVFLGFLNSNVPGNINVAKAALNLNAGPFKAYAAAEFIGSLNEAVGTVAYDPVCLQRCGLGEKFDQKPVEGTETTSTPGPDDDGNYRRFML